MASNCTYVCVPCRFVSKGTYVCPHCHASMTNFGKHWRAPRKNNNRAWKRIENREPLWDRRRVRRGRWKGIQPETVIKADYEIVQVREHPDDCDEVICKHFGPKAHYGLYKRVEVPGSAREVTNFHQSPKTVDMGG